MRATRYITALSGLLLALTALTAFAQGGQPVAWAFVRLSNDVVIVTGVNSQLVYGRSVQVETMSSDSSLTSYPPVTLALNTLDTCDQDVPFSDNSVCVPEDVQTAFGSPAEFWRFRARNPAQNIVPAQVRFGNGLGAWSDWRPLPSTGPATADAASNIFDDLRALELVVSRYDSYPATGDGGGDGMGAPTALLKDRLRDLPGGELVAIFLIPMIVAGFALMATRSPAILLLLIAASMAAAIFLVGASPFALVMPALIGGSGALIGIQFGYTRKFGS